MNAATARIHEAAHCVALHAFGARVLEVSAGPAGGWTRYNPADMTDQDESVASLVGGMLTERLGGSGTTSTSDRREAVGAVYREPHAGTPFAQPVQVGRWHLLGAAERARAVVVSERFVGQVLGLAAELERASGRIRGADVTAFLEHGRPVAAPLRASTTGWRPAGARLPGGREILDGGYITSLE